LAGARSAEDLAAVSVEHDADRITYRVIAFV
jgi:hypothetical protein